MKNLASSLALIALSATLVSSRAISVRGLDYERSVARQADYGPGFQLTTTEGNQDLEEVNKRQAAASSGAAAAATSAAPAAASSAPAAAASSPVAAVAAAASAPAAASSAAPAAASGAAAASSAPAAASTLLSTSLRGVGGGGGRASAPAARPKPAPAPAPKASTPESSPEHSGSTSNGGETTINVDPSTAINVGTPNIPSNSSPSAAPSAVPSGTS